MIYSFEKWCRKCEKYHPVNRLHWYFTDGKAKRCRQEKRNINHSRHAEVPIPGLIAVRGKTACPHCKAVGRPETRDAPPHVGIWCKACGAWIAWLKQKGAIDNVTKAMKERPDTRPEPRYSTVPRQEPLESSAGAPAVRFSPGRSGKDIVVDADGYLVRR